MSLTLSTLKMSFAAKAMALKCDGYQLCNKILPVQSRPFYNIDRLYCEDADSIMGANTLTLIRQL